MVASNRRLPTAALPVLLLALFAFGMSALVSRTVFERLPRLEDELTYLFQARMLARGQPVIASPEPRRAYWQPFVVDYQGRRFGKYPPGWPLLLAVGTSVGQPWIVNAWLAALTVALVYRLGCDVFNPDAGLIAAALTAFSPMALLLNATLMGHTAALACAAAFLAACARLERGRRPLRWGLAAGVALGLLVINRPVAGLALAAPVAAWSLVRFVRARRARLAILKPLLALAAAALLISAAIPLYNAAAAGDPAQNLYLLVWPYDRVGFGEGYGPRGHTLEKGLRQTRWDLSLAAADLFGWQIGPMPPPDLRLRTQAVYWPPVGVSWALIPLGLAVAGRRRWAAWAVWLGAGIAAFMLTTNLPIETLRDPAFAHGWLALAAAWLALPFAFLLVGRPGRQASWATVLLAAPLALILLHMAYWIGAQIYSTRYYFEGLTAAALLSALPLAALARRWRRWPVYAGLTALLLYSLYAYSTPRITPLYRFNYVTPELNAAVEARRDGRPALVIVTGSEVRWRALGSLMAVTSPFLDSDIVAAIDNMQPGVRDAILARFPDRQVIELYAAGNRACFDATMAGECYGAPPG